MAQLKKDLLKFDGSIGTLSIYKRRDLDKLIVRSKGGPDKKSIQQSENFANTRKLNKEWSGCAMAGKNIRMAIYPLRHVADYNTSGPLNAIVKIIQKLDTTGNYGERDIHFSKHRKLIEGFSLNKKNYWESIVKSPLSFNINRETGQAFIEVPALVPGINFENKYGYLLIRFTGVFGIVPDVRYNAVYNRYESINKENYGSNCYYRKSQWYSTKQGMEKLNLEINLPTVEMLRDTDTLVLAIGLEFGTQITNELIETIKYSGSGKILVTG